MNMNIRYLYKNLIFSFMLVLAFLFDLNSCCAAGAEKTNIILILSDDMGFSDLGCFGGEISTPNLDRLAAKGVRFTQFYNTARCCPTRASLLTGLHPHQAGIGHMAEDNGLPGYRGRIGQDTVTIAQVLKQAGYATFAAGKWHVSGSSGGPQKDISNWPCQRGFDRYYGTINGPGNYFDPSLLLRNNTYITAPTDKQYQPDNYYYTDALSDNMASFIQQHLDSQPEQPFFSYIAYTAAHWPMQAPEADIARNKGKYDAGYDAIRKARYDKMTRLG
ncbi:MAG: sulfatase-like hydrolase/transferase, partial [Sedimentisphaerales bacterium]|nr:sulfatase-like hydrolase/transferase [Sedimentisphaerales bacterium]